MGVDLDWIFFSFGIPFFLKSRVFRGLSFHEVNQALVFLHCWMGSPALPAVDTGNLAELKFFD